MKYKLVVSGGAEADGDELDLYLSGLFADISELSFVKTIARDQLTFEVETNEPKTGEQLKNSFKPFFSGERFCKVRFVSLESVK